MAKAVKRTAKKPAVPLAKLSAPTLPKLVERPRLFREIDQVRKGSPKVLWIQGPPGSGKTTLVASYLRANKLSALWYQLDSGDADVATWFHYLTVGIHQAAPRFRKPMLTLEPANWPDLPGFTRRFFEQVYARLKTSTLVVFDNYHEIPDESLLHSLMVEAFRSLPAGACCLVTSRQGPPAPLASLVAQQVLVEFPGEKLFLNVEETEALLRLHQPRKGDLQQLAYQLQKTTKGWVAGVILLGDTIEGREKTTIVPVEVNNHNVFDYFAQESLQRFSQRVRLLLLQTAMFPAFTEDMAEQMSGVSHAGMELRRLVRACYFVENRKDSLVIFQYHPLFKRFLEQQAEMIFGTEAWLALRKQAGEILEQEGWLEEALDMFIAARLIENAKQVMLKLSPAMYAQGRFQTLGRWLAALPSQECDQDPRLIYWQGMSRLFQKPAESIALFRTAFEQFQVQGNVEGMVLSASGGIHAIEHTWSNFDQLDEWIEVIESLWDEHSSSFSSKVQATAIIAMVHGLFWRQPQKTIVQIWLDRAETLMLRFERFNEIPLLTYYAVYCAIWFGSIAQALRITTMASNRLEEHTLSPSGQVMWATTQSVAAWISGDFPAAKRYIQQGFDLAELHEVWGYSGALVTSGLYVALNSRDIKYGEVMVKRGWALAHRVGPVFYAGLYFQAGWLNALKEDMAEARQLAAHAPSLAIQSQSPYAEAVTTLGLAWILAASGCIAEVGSPLRRVELLSQTMQNFTLKFSCHLLKAFIALKKTNQLRALQELRDGLTLGRQYSLLYSSELWLPSILSPLCALALEQHIEVDYVRQLIRARRLTLNARSSGSAQWPWPLRIYTLGRFQLVTVQGPITFGRKIPVMPLRLLKALIAQGGQAVPLTELADLLWPDAEGDAAYRSILTTLGRLRKLLGQEEILLVQGGLLSLNADLCWVDSLAFEGLIQQGRVLRQAGQTDKADEVEARALALYQGPFLVADLDCSWAIPARERLANQCARLADVHST